MVQDTQKVPGNPNHYDDDYNYQEEDSKYDDNDFCNEIYSVFTMVILMMMFMDDNERFHRDNSS